MTPLSYLHTHGPAGDPLAHLAWGLGAISIIVVVIIIALVLIATFHTRPAVAVDGQGRCPIGRDVGGVRWVYIGVGISTVVLFLCAIWMLAALAAVSSPPTAPAFKIEVTGNQWWWSVRYLGNTPSNTFVTANEIHIPVGEPVRIDLIGGDVIHSFWVPKLAGKTDTIPGQTNQMWLQADQPGTYRGQCTEYCGVQHAHMGFIVVAEPRAQFEAWRANQLAAAPQPTSDLEKSGLHVFQARCGACHAVRGSDAAGILGPDLTHVMSRSTLAAATWPNGPGRIAGWIMGAQSIKPGCRMPQLSMQGNEMGALLAYLKTLQ
ncbi:MAG TPA: cytochrome c oxidase subunit II [Burkholderiales bacterium]|nr:cytochrome c oxidase subunit II [Burkholderiales bacterium]